MSKDLPDPESNPIRDLYTQFNLPLRLSPYQLYLSLPSFSLSPIPKRKAKTDFPVSSTRFYTGQVKGRLCDGAGVSVSSDGAIHEGCYQAGKLHGRGRLIDANGTVLEGEWVEGVMRGKGRIKHAEGAQYEGEVYNGMPHGEGIERWEDGGFYQGNFVEGKKHGYGVFQWSRGK